MVRKPSLGERVLRRLADAPDEADRLRREEAGASAGPITAKPRGLSRSEAILARNLLPDRPTETVMPISRSISPGEAGQRPGRAAPCSRSVPDRSRKASSIDSGSTSGVSSSIIARTSRPTATYFAMSGVITTASGQSLSALNIGMAERTP